MKTERQGHAWKKFVEVANMATEIVGHFNGDKFDRSLDKNKVPAPTKYRCPELLFYWYTEGRTA